MRRVLALLLVCAFFCLAGCGGAGDGKATQDTTGVGTELAQTEGQPGQQHASTAGDKAGKNSPVQETDPQQEQPSQTLRKRATAEKCDRSLDVTTILPRFGVYENGRVDYGTRYVALLCQCAAVSGETVWLYISVEDYEAFFDSGENMENCRFRYSNVAAFPQPIRVSCATVAAESLTPGLSAYTGEQVLLFGEAHSSAETDTVAVMYTDLLPPMTCVYTDAMAVEPVFLLANGCAEENTDVICRVTALDGSTVWLAMTVTDYALWIDPNADLREAEQTDLTKVTWEKPLRLYGVALDAEVIASGLGDIIGTTTAVSFVAVDEN